MNIKQKLTTLLLLVAGAATQLNAQTAVTAGSQVTDASTLVSGKAYLLQHQGNGNNTPWLEDAGTYYNCPNSAGNCNLASVWYLIDNGDNTWEIENAYTGKYWPKPTSNANLVGTDASNAGHWALNFSNGVAAPTCNGFNLNRNTPNLVGWNGGSGSVTQIKIYEVTVSSLSTTASYSTFTDKDISVSASEAASISEGQWYVMKNRGRNGYAYEDNGSMKNQAAAPGGSATDNAKYLVRFLNAGSGKYYLQNGLGNYWGAISHNTAVPATALGTEKYTVGKINATDGHFYLTSETSNTVLDCQDNDYPVVGWNTTVPTSTGGNNDWALYPVEFVESWVPTASEVYTINNTNSGRGALIYNPDASTKYVWSSGKSGTFDATNANSQWVIVPTETAKQYYLYNVGADKFAIPTGIAQDTGNSWVFSDNAVAVIFETQGDGTKKIKMASSPVSGTNAAYMSVSNNYTGPIINYNDVGSKFTITKVDGDASTAVGAAVARLVKNQTALTSYPQATGWYVLQIKRSDNNSNHVGRYVYAAASLYNNLYPLTFTGNVDIQPSITDPTFFTYINYTAWDNNKWQLSDGRYLVDNGSNKFPTASATAGNVIAGYDSGNYFKNSNNYYADAYNSNANYFIGETTSFRTVFSVYPIDLEAAGLVAWQVICDDAPESSQISCTRSDVSGLTSVYKNGYFFLPTGVTPEAGDFELDGATGVTVDASAKTITLAYNPNWAIVEDGVTVEQGWQTAGRGGEVMLLRVTAQPFKDATGTTLTVSLKDGSEANISALKLYEANSSSPEIYSTGTGAPTKTEVATASISGSTATFDIGNLAAGTHYYWIGATVKSDATLGAIIDAAVTDLTYTCNENETVLDLTSVGDPADRGAMVFNVHSYPFLPRDNGSRVYRIPAMVVADDGSIVVACDKRYDSHTDIGRGHVIDIVVRRSTDGGRTWGEPVVVAKGDNSNDATCGYGDPSLYKGNDGKLYCLYGAGNTGYFYGLKRVCVSVSTDNGATWDTADTSPTDLTARGKLTDHATSYGSNTCYGLFDYFVTSGRGLCTSEGYLMALLPAQPYTDSDQTAHTSNSQNYIFYSTDQGETWHISENAIFTGGDEAKVIQTGDGSLIASIRQGGNRGFNTATYTANGNGTLTFTMGTQWNNSQLNAGGYANNQDIFYYQREPATGKTDVIFHSMTTGQHANLKLYYSTDQGQNWTEFLNVQTKGTRYVTMERSGSEENPGSLYLFFEDQSLNNSGGYTDYNHYPLNFLEITREQLESLIPTLNEYNIQLEDEVKITSGLTAETTYGSWSGLTWTSNADSGVAGLTMALSNGEHDKYSSWNNHYNIAFKPAAAGAASTLTLTAPEGYFIQGYSLLAAKASSAEHTYTLTAEDGTSITPAFANSASGYTEFTVTNVNAASTSISFTTTDAGKYIAIADFTVTLTKAFPLNIIDDKSYATLYLPFDVTTTGATKAYYVASANNGSVQMTETSGEGTEIPARTAVVLINSEAATSAAFTRASGLTPVVTEDANLLKGTLVSKSLDLSDASSFYSLGKYEDKIGFYKFSGGTITLGANKAYLEVPAGGSVKGFTFSFDDATDIEMVNGQRTTDNAIYNLAGQMVNGKSVNGLPKGIYIMGGRKILK